jgi:hypothetical protein
MSVFILSRIKGMGRHELVLLRSICTRRMIDLSGIFLENMMRKLGFQDRWISLMMACVKSVRYQVRFNSEETEMFTPMRGLR